MSVGETVALLRRKLEEALAPTTLEIDVVDADSGKFSLTIVSEAFRGKPLIARHRAVNDVLKDELQSGAVHALTISAHPPPAQ